MNDCRWVSLPKVARQAFSATTTHRVLPSSSSSCWVLFTCHLVRSCLVQQRSSKWRPSHNRRGAFILQEKSNSKSKSKQRIRKTCLQLLAKERSSWSRVLVSFWEQCSRIFLELGRIPNKIENWQCTILSNYPFSPPGDNPANVVERLTQRSLIRNRASFLSWSLARWEVDLRSSREVEGRAIEKLQVRHRTAMWKKVVRVIVKGMVLRIILPHWACRGELGVVPRRVQALPEVNIFALVPCLSGGRNWLARNSKSMRL